MKKGKVNILCLYWVGQFRGRDFTMFDVVRLYQTVSKHIDRPFDFYCLTNSTETFPKFVKPIPLIYAWPGWWSKMEIHRTNLPSGRTLYMDLDSHAVRSLGPILDYPGDLVMFPTKIPMEKQAHLAKEGWVLCYQAATMLFDSGTAKMQWVWKKFLQNPGHWMNMYRSDQDVMGDWIPNQPTFPIEWMAKLITIKDEPKLRDNVIIITGQTKDGLFRKTNTIPWFEAAAR